MALAVVACAGRQAGPVAPSSPDERHSQQLEAEASPPQASRKPSQPAREPLPRDVVAQAAQPFSGFAEGRRLTDEELWQRLAVARAICLGEQHSSASHHYLQHQVLLGLAEREADAGALGVGFEMFQHPYQKPLSDFSAGKLDEAGLLSGTEYGERWGFDFSLYRPLLEVTREFELDALALNAPKELTRAVGRGGLEALSESERSTLPELDLDSQEHREYFDAAMGGHPMPKGGPSLDDIYTAQVIWDETMAQRAARWLQPDASGDAANRQLVILAGKGHCHRSAIPARLSRRSGIAVLAVSPISSSTLESGGAAVERASKLYDLLLVLEEE